MARKATDERHTVERKTICHSAVARGGSCSFVHRPVSRCITPSSRVSKFPGPADFCSRHRAVRSNCEHGAPRYATLPAPETRRPNNEASGCELSIGKKATRCDKRDRSRTARRDGKTNASSPSRPGKLLARCRPHAHRCKALGYVRAGGSRWQKKRGVIKGEKEKTREGTKRGAVRRLLFVSLLPSLTLSLHVPLAQPAVQMCVKYRLISR